MDCILFLQYVTHCHCLQDNIEQLCTVFNLIATVGASMCLLYSLLTLLSSVNQLHLVFLDMRSAEMCSQEALAAVHSLIATHPMIISLFS